MRPPQLRSDYSQETEDLEYQLKGAADIESWSDTIIKSLREQLLSVRSDADEYCQPSPLYTESFMAAVTDGFNGFLYNLGT